MTTYWVNGIRLLEQKPTGLTLANGHLKAVYLATEVDPLLHQAKRLAIDVAAHHRECCGDDAILLRDVLREIRL